MTGALVPARCCICRDQHRPKDAGFHATGNRIAVRRRALPRYCSPPLASVSQDEHGTTGMDESEESSILVGSRPLPPGIADATSCSGEASASCPERARGRGGFETLARHARSGSSPSVPVARGGAAGATQPRDDRSIERTALRLVLAAGRGYEGATAHRAGAPGDDLTVGVKLQSTGHRAGREVAQVCASKPDSSVERPLRWLAGFASVHAEPGQTVTAAVSISSRPYSTRTPAPASR